MAKQRKTKTNEELIQYQLEKIEYHIKRALSLGVPKSEIFQRIDYTPQIMPYDQIAGSLQFWGNPTLWRNLLFAVWRFKIVETEETNENQSKITYVLGPYKNHYMRVQEKEDRKNMLDEFLNPLNFENTDSIPCFNNAMYYEQYTAIFPVPADKMKEVIELLQVKKDAPECTENRARAREILNHYFHQ